MIERLKGKHVVLLGIGHTNAHIVRMWKMHAPADADLTCISNNPIATYSGMLPAMLAGQIPRSQMEIDLVRFCSFAGARLILDPVTGINHDRNEVEFGQRPPIPFDVLSIGVGSTTSVGALSNTAESLVSIKPMQSFVDRLRQAVAAAETRNDGELKVLIVGSGVAGVEISFCIPGLLASVSNRGFSLHMITGSDKIATELLGSTRDRVARVLESRKVSVTTGKTVTGVCTSSVTLDDGSTVEADVVIWATGASPPELLARLGLATDQRGFLATDSNLQSTSAPGIFAVGDTGTIAGQSLPKAGVYAVRQGPILWQNIQRSIDGRPLVRYQPQTSFLKLINLGDGTAIGQWKGWSFQGRWVMKLKQWIDGGFMDKFRVKPMATVDDSGMDAPVDMQCRGCGCKLGAEVLESALDNNQSIPLEDAAEIGSGTLIASTDFFSSPVDDAFLSGRIAALHSASDIIATGARPSEALANVVLPDGDRTTQRRVLRDFLSGARSEFDAMGAAVVGGHTIVGPRMEIGFTVIGKPLADRLIRKSNLRDGDELLLTKPLGSGILMAAHMRHQCQARDYVALLDAMLQRQHDFAQIATDLGIDAGTDITGFGLAGHLIEMLTESGVGAEIELDAIPLLPGAVDTVSAGIASSLLPDNLRSQRHIVADHKARERPEFQLLFDPQTCGGLLFGVAADIRDEFLSRVAAASLDAPVRIGRVVEVEANQSPLQVIE